jgi:hypothetical protein
MAASCPALILAVLGVLASVTLGAAAPGESSEAAVGAMPPASGAAAAALPSVDEARARARLLHETIDMMLQVVHRDFYQDDEGLPIPAASLKKVFRELAGRTNIELRWLAVSAQAMNVDHAAKSAFDKDAVKALASGADEFERVEGNQYRRAGAITLTSDCLKCHLPNRTSTDDRTAGLIIVLPVDNR